MPIRTLRPLLVSLRVGLALGLGLLLQSTAGLAADTGTRADFSGTWGLNDDRSEDPFDVWLKAGGGSSASRGGGGRGGRGDGAPADAPPAIVMEGERRLVVVDEGATVRVSRGPGRERVLFTDGREVAIDDADGPATLSAKRKGSNGERIDLSIAWSNGRSVNETWELQANPRRIAVRTKVGGRHSFSYKRVYEPLPDAPPAVPETVPAPVVTVASAAPATPVTSSASSAARPSASAAPPAIPPGPAVRPECSIRPPKRTPQAELNRLAKVSVDDAAGRARAAVLPAHPSSVVSSEVEVVDGCLAWSFFLRFADRKGVQEVVIDAGDGKLLASTYEEPSGGEPPQR